MALSSCDASLARSAWVNAWGRASSKRSSVAARVLLAGVAAALGTERRLKMFRNFPCKGDLRRVLRQMKPMKRATNTPAKAEPTPMAAVSFLEYVQWQELEFCVEFGWLPAEQLAIVVELQRTAELLVVEFVKFMKH